MFMLGILIVGISAFFAFYALPNYYQEKLALCSPIIEHDLDLDNLLRENDSNCLKEIKRILNQSDTFFLFWSKRYFKKIS